MRTVLIIVGGLILFGLCVAAARSFGALSPMALAIKVFIPVWLCVALLNMWVGVTRAGYSVAEEFPIFCGIFAVPVAVALLVWWKA